MAILRFDGDLTLDDVFDKHKGIIYDNAISTIRTVYSDPNITKIQAAVVEINNTTYNLNIQRSQFIQMLTSAITEYEKTEEYEKCGECMKIINELKEKNK